MDKLTYLIKLEKELKHKLSKREINDIIRDYAEYFEEGRRQGKSDEEICASLGEPSEVAKEILDESNMSSEEFADTIKKGIDKGKSGLSSLGCVMKGLIAIICFILALPFLGGIGVAVICLIFVLFLLIGSMLVIPIGLIFAAFSVLIAAAVAFSVLPFSISIMGIFGFVAMIALAIFMGSAIMMLTIWLFNCIKNIFLWLGRIIKNQTSSGGAQ